MYEVRGFYKLAELDNYENGVDPARGCCIKDDMMFWQDESLHGLLQQLHEFLGGQGNLSDVVEVSEEEEGMIEFCVMEVNNGTAPSDSEIERWKRGECDIWKCIYTFYVNRVAREPVDSFLLQAACFPEMIK